MDTWGRDSGRSKGSEAGREQDAEHEDAERAQSDHMRLLAMRRRQVQRKAARQAGTGAKIPTGGGSAMPSELRERMEPQLGADLSGVKIHTGGESQTAAEKLGAHAFTTGSDVHFAAGQFAPGTKEGDRLIAHELTHAVQAQKSGIQRKAGTPVNDDAGLEHEADAMGAKAAGGAHDSSEGHGPEHEVSQPGDPAEREADAVADNAAENLHGGADGGGAGKKIARAAGSHAAPQIGAKLSGRQISLKKDDKKPDAKDDKKKDKKTLAKHTDPRVVVEDGKYKLAPEFRDKSGNGSYAFCRTKCYGSQYNDKVDEWKERMLTTTKPKGGLRHPTDKNKYWYKDKYYENKGNDAATIGHEKPPVAEHWSTKGNNTDQKGRRDYYTGHGDPEKNLLIQPRSVNCSDGASDDKSYTAFVGPDFRGP